MSNPPTKKRLVISLSCFVLASGIVTITVLITLDVQQARHFHYLAVGPEVSLSSVEARNKKTLIGVFQVNKALVQFGCDSLEIKEAWVERKAILDREWLWRRVRYRPGVFVCLRVEDGTDILLRDLHRVQFVSDRGVFFSSRALKVFYIDISGDYLPKSFEVRDAKTGQRIEVGLAPK